MLTWLGSDVRVQKERVQKEHVQEKAEADCASHCILVAAEIKTSPVGPKIGPCLGPEIRTKNGDRISTHCTRKIET